MWNGREARKVSIGSIPGRPLEREHPRKRVFTSAKAQVGRGKGDQVFWLVFWVFLVYVWVLDTN